MSIAEMNPSRKQAYTDPGISQTPEPTYAERVRTLPSLCTIPTRVIRVTEVYKWQQQQPKLEQPHRRIPSNVG